MMGFETKLFFSGMAIGMIIVVGLECLTFSFLDALGKIKWGE